MQSSVGERVKTARRQLKLSQYVLRERLVQAGLPWSQTTVSKVEAGERVVKLHEGPVLADVLGVNILWLAGDDSAETRTRVVVPDPEAQRALKRIRTIAASALGDEPCG